MIKRLQNAQESERTTAPVNQRMKRIDRLQYIVLFLFSLSPAGTASILHAQQTQSIRITLEEAQERAVQQSVSLRKNALDLETAAYAANHLWSEFFPSISASAGVNYGSNLFTNGGFTLEESNAGYSVSAGVSLNLNAGLPLSMRIITLAYQSQLLTYEDAKRQLGIQVTKSFYNLLAEKQNLALLEEKLDLARKQGEKSRTAFRNGLVSERSDMQTQLAVENARLDMNKAYIQYASHVRDFLTLTGMDAADMDASGVELEGVIEIAEASFDAESLIRDFLPQRPDIVRQRQTIERLELTKQQRALSGKAPSLSGSIRWSGSPGNAASSAPFSDSVSGSLSVTIPIDPWIPGTKSYQTVKSAETDVEKARLDLVNAETTAKNEIRNLCAGLRNLWGTIEIARIQATIAERAYRLTEQAFQQGAAEALTLEDSRNALTAARQQLLSAELAYKLGILDIEAAVNADL
ncbi:MAG: TolC family protein [Treponema sp.]|jgi:outer membrane protein TolC|nr:TolC family protein [Treponema sp.]